jgi:hypothetical protein
MPATISTAEPFLHSANMNMTKMVMLATVRH